MSSLGTNAPQGLHKIPKHGRQTKRGMNTSQRPKEHIKQDKIYVRGAVGKADPVPQVMLTPVIFFINYSGNIVLDALKAIQSVAKGRRHS